MPLVVFGSAFAGLGRFLVGCSADDGTLMRTRDPSAPSGSIPNTDDDEYVPPTGEPPVVANETPPKVPSPQWESRARQLEDEQARVYGAVFTEEAPGVMAGKQRAHVPEVVRSVENGLTRVTVLVRHVMDKNGLDAGAVDASGVDASDARADAADAADAARDGEAGASDAGKPQIHYITTVYLRADVGGKDTVVGLWEYASTDAAPPTVKFTLPAGVTRVVAYEWCTLHGLWKSAPVAV